MLVLGIIFMVLTLLSPADVIPSLAPFRPMLVITVIGLVAAFVGTVLQPQLLEMPQTLLMIGFYGVIISSQPLHGWAGGSFYSAQSFGAAFVIFFLILASAKDVPRLRWVATFVVIIALYYFVRVVMAYHFNIDAEKFMVWEWTEAFDPETGEQLKVPRVRGLGLLSDPNDLGQLMLFSIAMIAMAYYKAPKIRKMMLIPLVAALFYTIYLTSSRGTIIGMAALIIAIMHDRMGKWGPFVGAGLTALLVLGLGFGGGRGFSTQTGSGGERLKMWSETLALIKSYPIFGVGFNNAMDYLWNTTHNSYLLCFVELGIFGYMFWMGILVVSFIQLRAVMRLKDAGEQAQPVARAARAIFFSFIAIVVSSFFLSRAYAFIFYVLLGLSAAVWRIARDKFPDRIQPVLWPQLAWNTGVTMVGVIVLIYVMVRVHWA
jgi:putative inorganic carbon (hco3(-)) transporter